MSDAKQRHLDAASLALWEAQALLRLVERAAGVNFLNDADWEAPHAVHLRHRNTGKLFMMVRTDHREYLRVYVGLAKDFDAREARKSLGLPLRKATSETTYNRYELHVTKCEEISSPQFEQFFSRLVDCFPRLCEPSIDVSPGDFAKLSARGRQKEVEASLSSNPKLAREPRAINEASAKGHVDVVGLLLSHGADPNSAAPLSRTIQDPEKSLRKLPLHQAVGELRQNAVAGFKRRDKHLQTARLLMESGADLEARATRQEVPPLISAALGGSRAMTDLLLEHGARRSFFALAALGDVKGLRGALTRTASLAKQLDQNNMTALMYCAASRLGIEDPRTAVALAETAEVLIEHGAPLNALRENYWSGEPPHHLNATSFAALGNASVLRVLLKHDVCTDIGGKSFTAIGQAVMARSEATLCLLLADQIGEPIDAPQFAGWTSTHWLAASLQPVDQAEKMALWIADKGILQLTAKDAAGHTPIEVARSRGADKFADVLVALS